jgi:hypothetical protein
MMSFNLRNKPYPKGRRINNLLVFDLTLLFSLYLQILCIASVTEMIFKCGEGKIRRSKAVSYLYGVPKAEGLVLVLTLLLYLCPCTGVRAQTPVIDDTESAEDGLEMIARSFTDSVRLRWAPTNYRMWAKVRNAGLHVERNTLTRNGEMLPLAERQQISRLTTSPITPKPEPDFGARAAENRYVAIGGQALYGESFEPGSSAGDDASYGGILNKAREQSNRFSFGLFAADQSWEAAAMMGLAFTDSTAQRNEVYLYRLVPSTPIPGYDPQRSGFLTVVVNDNAPPPTVKRLSAEFTNRQAVLSWDLEVASSFYSSYNILRSEDGISFEKVNKEDLPFVPLVKPGQGNKAFFQDSPSVTGVFPLQDGGFSIGWNFPESEAINGFKIERARKNAGPYEEISVLLGAEIRAFTDPAPMPSNYYKVTVFDQYDRTLSSYAVLAQPNDEEPPAVPSGLRGLILKDGRMIISWDDNPEEDLLGYRIWLSNQPDAEYSLATGAPIEENYFVGKTTLKTLSRKLYAKVLSLDFRHNTSDLSDYIELLRPDTIPPAPPLMKNVRANRDSLIVSWAFSRSIDVENQVLQRRPLGATDADWVTLTTFSPPLAATTGEHADTELARGDEFEYRMVATDFSGLQSTSKTMWGNIIDDFIRKQVEDVSASADRREKTINLRWNYDPEKDNLKYFEVWRALPGKNPISIARVTKPAVAKGRKKPAFRFVDEGPLKMNTTYRYHIKAIYADGGESSLSAAVEVRY